MQEPPAPQYNPGWRARPVVSGWQAYVHGGGDLGLLTILQHMMFLGMMTYSGGASCGSPVIHLGPEAINADHDSYGELFEVFGKRFAEQTVKVFG